VGVDPSEATILFANGGEPLYRSTDGGGSCQVVLTNAQLDNLKQGSIVAQEPDKPGFSFHALAVAASPGDPTHVYVNRDSRFGGSTLLRTDDGGMSWQSVLAFRGGGGRFCSEPGDLNVQISGLAADDTGGLYVARNASRPGTFPTHDTILTSGVMVSTDDGASWNDLGSQQRG